MALGRWALGVGKAEDEACDYKSLKRSIALEVAKYGITVNCVAPESTQNGWIDEAFEDAVLAVKFRQENLFSRKILPKQICFSKADKLQ